MIEADSLVRIPDAARRAAVSTRKMWQMIASGNAPPVVRLGRSTRMRASDLDLWICLGCPSQARLEVAKNAGSR